MRFLLRDGEDFSLVLIESDFAYHRAETKTEASALAVYDGGGQYVIPMEKEAAEDALQAALRQGYVSLTDADADYEESDDD